MTSRTWPFEIISPLIRRCRAGKAAIIVVLHPGDGAPKTLLAATEELLRDENIRTFRVRLADLAPNPVPAMILMVQTGIDAFSLVCDPETVRKDAGAVVNALNIHRNTYAGKGLCTVFWIPSYLFGDFADHASNFLDFRNRFIETDLNGMPLKSGYPAPKFFVPRPPWNTFFRDHKNDIASLGKCVEKHDKVAVIGGTYYGWPGGPSALVRAYLHQNRDSFANEGGVFRIDGSEPPVSETAHEAGRTDPLTELALKMDVGGGLSAEERVNGVCSYLHTYPGSVIFYEAVRDPYFLKKKLPGGRTLLTLGGRLIITTPRRDISRRDFGIISVGSERSAERPKSKDDVTRFGLRRRYTAEGGHQNSVTDTAWSPNGQILAFSYDKFINLRNFENGKLHKRIGTHHRILSMTWSPDGKMLATGTDEGNITVLDSATGKTVRKLSGHSGSMAWSPDGRRIASGSADRTLLLRDVNTWEILHRLEHPAGVRKAVWSPDCRNLASCYGGKTVLIWDVHIGTCVREIRDHDGTICSLAWSSDGKLASGAEDGTIRIRDAETGLRLHEFETQGAVRGLAFSDDSRFLGSASDDAVMIWRSDISELATKIDGLTSPCLTPAFHPKAPLLASSGQKGDEICVWDMVISELLAEKDC